MESFSTNDEVVLSWFIASFAQHAQIVAFSSLFPPPTLAALANCELLAELDTSAIICSNFVCFNEADCQQLRGSSQVHPALLINGEGEAEFWVSQTLQSPHHSCGRGSQPVTVQD